MICASTSTYSMHFSASASPASAILWNGLFAIGRHLRHIARIAFPNGEGNIEFHANIVTRGLQPPQVAAGLTVPAIDRSGKPKLDKEGKPVLVAKYTGLHALRHFYAIWLLNPKDKGGMELPMKIVQERMGHSSIVMTADTYGHLFPSTNDQEALAAAEKALLGA